MGKIHALRSLRKTLLWAGLLGLAMTGRAAIVESTTEVFVAKATVIKGKTGAMPQVTYVSLPTLPGAVYAGVVSALGPGTLVDASATWQQGQFNGLNGSFYIHFQSGSAADILQTQAATKTLTYPGTLPQDVAVGSKYQIRKHPTFADIFGSQNEVGLQPGFNKSGADNILIHAPESQQTFSYFFSSVSGYEGWYRDDYTPANSTVVHPEQGIMILRKVFGDLVLYLHGPAQNGPAKVPVFTGYNLLGTLKGAANLKLSQLNLYTGDPNTGLASGNNMAEADNLILINPNTTTTTYFYSSYPGWEGWFDAAFQPAGNVTVSSGMPFFLHRKPSRGLFRWSIPEE